MQIVNQPPQFYDKLPGVNEEYWNGRTEVSNQDFLGLVMDYDEEEKWQQLRLEIILEVVKLFNFLDKS